MVLVAMLTVLHAHAATWSPEDLVTAHARGLPGETVARMAESVGIDEATTVYLLRRGVPGEAIAAWGRPVSEAEGITALRLGPIDTPPPAVSDVARVDAAVLDHAIESRVYDPEAIELPVEARRAVLVRRGNTSVALGAVLSLAGGLVFGMGAMGPAGDPRIGSWAHRPAAEWLLGPMALPTWMDTDRDFGEPSALVMGVGALGIVTGGVTFSFGARQLALAGSARDPWTDAE